MHVQAVVCLASTSLAVAVAIIQVGGGRSGLLPMLVTAWALLLPLGLLLQAVLPLPPPHGPLPYGGLTPHFQRERAESYRHVLRFAHMHSDIYYTYTGTSCQIICPWIASGHLCLFRFKPYTLMPLVHD